MQRLALLLLLSIPCALTTAGCGHASASARAPSQLGQPSLLVNLTHGKNDLHAASMGLGLAKAALEHGSSVVVFLNVDAAALADRDLGADVRFADFPPVVDLLRDIIAGGGKIFVCAHCAKVAKLGEDRIAPGIAFSEHGDIVKALHPGMVGFSY
jgi:predicted peroxiredoxin